MTVTNLGVYNRSASNQLGIRTYTEVYKVETTQKTEGSYAVGSAFGIPAIADQHPDDSAAYCISIDPDNTNPWKGWEVTCTYSTERIIGANPLNDEILLQWTSEIYQEPVFTDVDGNAILNSAGDYFIDPAQMRDSAHLIVKIMANVNAVPSWVLSYQNAVNNSAITIGGLSIAERLAKVQSINISSVKRRNAFLYYEFEYEVHLHRDGWRSRPLDAGFRQLVGGELIQIRDNNGDEVTTPVPLNGSGQVIALPTPANAVYGNYKIYPELDLTSLPGIS